MLEVMNGIAMKQMPNTRIVTNEQQKWAKTETPNPGTIVPGKRGECIHVTRT